ncbi:non-ribosomal peptide synthetase [Nocardiopsis sp. FIRDI 009]|uniref:non-ribosomal peptide synthetase n=1 Tax=Nocardiopsis sp. FIRDI 009 TaxID=714197 RepID=UPI000E225330|nr:non-ribosomal peptide synthetase [Nocardiopsis sp. FIRDI 009]
MTTPSTSRPAAGRSSLSDTRQRLMALRERQRSSGLGTGDAITRTARDRALPTSFTQQRLWFLDRWAPGRSVYNSPIALRLRGDLDTAALQRALTALVARHEILRTRYPSENGVPFQQIDPVAEVPLPVVEAPGSGERTRAHVSELAAAPFDLENGPVFRAHLVRCAADDHVLLLSLHHIATDGWSTSIVTRELVELYGAERSGGGADLPELPVQYADYAVWQRGRMTGGRADEQLAYWRDRLTDLPVLDLPTDRPRPGTPTHAGTTLDRVLPARLRDDLNRLARTERVTLMTVVLAAFTVVMSKYTQQDDIVVGSVWSGRGRPEVERLVGFFSNTLVLRTSTAGDPTLRELLARTRDTVMGAHFNEDVPFGRLVEELSPDRDPDRNPLFQTSFTLQHAAVESAEVEGLRIETYPVESGTARFDLAVQLTELPDGLRLWAEYSTELFDTARIARLFDHYEQVLRAMVADPGLRLSEVDVLTGGELATVTGAWSDGGAGGREELLHSLFEARAAERPDGVALRFAGEDTTYRELDESADRIAWALHRSGVGPEHVVGVLLDRGPHIPAAYLGAGKAGAAFLPLDPDHPEQRRAAVLADAGCEVVITTDELAALLPGHVRAVTVAQAERSDAPAGPPPAESTGRNLAYVIFTSGSTGRPKGVQVEQRSIANFTEAIVERFALGPGDRVLQFANPAYDVSLFDFFAALASGATLVQAPRDTLLDPASLTELMRAEGVTVTDLPPAVLGLLDPDELPDLRALFVGLEAFPAELVNAWRTEHREFHNGYGPTEATVACTDYACRFEEHTSMPPIGGPLRGYRVYVLDRFGAPVPEGVPGELYVAGAGVARGYAGRPAGTAERFVPDPYGPPGSRAYRTGDLVCWESTGDLRFLGRVDDQIKIRGLRVEPGEVERAVTAHPGVAEALVVCHGSGADARLTAYLVPADPGAGELDLDGVRRAAAEHVPTSLVPGAMVVLPELPRGANGKVDRGRLPAPDAGAARKVRVPPSTSTHRTLAEIWRTLLNRDDQHEVDINDGFFEVGGNSLKVTELAARVESAFGVRLELRDLFVNSSIASLADLIEADELDTTSDEDLMALLDETEGTNR